MRSHARISVGILSALLLLTSFVVCSQVEGQTRRESGATNKTTSNSSKLVSVILGARSINAMHQWLMVAEQEGFMEKNGVKLDVVTFARTADIIPALLGGSINFGLATPEQLFAAQDKQKSIKIVANEVSRSPYIVYAKNPDIRSLSDLKGKTLGVSSVGGSVDYFTYKLLLHNLGMEEGKDYHIVNAGGISQRVNALINGQVDSEMVYPPGNEILGKAGARQIFNVSSDRNYDNLVVNVLISDQKWYGKHEKAAVAFMRGYLESVKWLLDPANKEKAITDIGKAMKVDNSQAKSAYVEFVERAKAFPASAEVTPDQIKKTVANARMVGLKAAPTDDDLDWRYDNSLIKMSRKAD